MVSELEVGDQRANETATCAHSGPRGRGVVWHATAILLSIGLCGCEGDSSAPPSPPPTAPSPQERFDGIVETIRELLEGGVSSRDPRGSVSGVYTVEASPKITDNETDGEPLKGYIKISLKTRFYANLSDDKEEGQEDPVKKEPKRRNSFTEGMDAFDGSEAEILDEGLIPEIPGQREGNSNPRIPIPSLRTTEADNQTVYDLEFVRDRWRLASPPKDGALPSMNEALQLALKRQ